MRRRRAWKAGEEDERDFGLQIAPLLDLLFVMLLFFMITAGGPRHARELALRLPASGADGTANAAAPAPPPAVIRLDIDPAGQVYCNQMPVDGPRDALLPALRERLQKALAETGGDGGGSGASPLVVVTPHARTPHARVMEVLSACAAAQVRRLAFGAPAE